MMRCLESEAFKGRPRNDHDSRTVDSISARGPLDRGSAVGAFAGLRQGFGPDPFRPYNNQYDPYVYPTSPPGFAASGAASALGRRDNQFQQYLEQQDGAQRASSSSERYGQGVPHWKARSDSEASGPNSTARIQTNPSVERQVSNLESIHQKYLAYFSEDDPKKQAVLLREFNSNRRGSAARRPSGGKMTWTIGTPRRMAPTGDCAPGLAKHPTIELPPGRPGAELTPVAASAIARASDADEAESDAIPPPPPLRGSYRGTTRRNARPTKSSNEALMTTTPIDSRRPVGDEQPGRPQLPPMSEAGRDAITVRIH